MAEGSRFEEIKKSLQEVEKAESLEEIYNTRKKAKKRGRIIPESTEDSDRRLKETKALQRHLAEKELEILPPVETLPQPKISERFRDRLRKLEEKEASVTEAFETGAKALLEVGKILLEAQATIRERKIERTARGKIEQTEGDLEAERMILDAIRRAFPDDTILSEEAAKKHKRPEELLQGSAEHGVWYVDPLDGTRSYGSNRMNFATMLAREKNGHLQFGIIFLPARGELYYAVRGAGAFLNEKEITVNKDLKLRDGFLELNQTRHGRAHLFDEDKLHPPVFSRTIPTECEGAAFAALARGNTVAHVAARAKAWDIAPGMIIVTEAGGRVTNLENQDIDLHGPSEILVASTREEHDSVLNVLKGARY